MAKYIIGFVGEQASGKDHGAAQLGPVLNANTHKFSAPMSDCLRYLGIPNTRDNLVDFSVFTREGRKGGKGFFDREAPIVLDETRWLPALDKCLERLLLPPDSSYRAQFAQLMIRLGWNVPGFGDNLYSKVVAANCLSDPGEFVFANGIRRMPDIENLIALPNFYLIYVTAPARVRYERIRKRNERPGEADLTWEKFLELEQASTEIDIPRIGREYAHFKYTNIGSPEAYKAFLDSVVTTIRSAH